MTFTKWSLITAAALLCATPAVAESPPEREVDILQVDYDLSQQYGSNPRPFMQPAVLYIVIDRDSIEEPRMVTLIREEPEWRESKSINLGHGWVFNGYRLRLIHEFELQPRYSVWT